MFCGSRSAVVAVLLAVLILPAASLAQKVPKVKYDPATETKISGTIEEVKEFQCPVSGALGYHLVLKTGGQPDVVHVAASKFMKEYEITFAKGDQVQVVGVKVKLESGEDAILAREIVRGQSTFTFRDKAGKPLW